MFADQADQGHQADLRVDVERRPAQRQRNQGAADRQRHGDEDDQRVAQAFVLRGQHHVDDDEGEQEGQHQRVAFVDKLPRIRLPVMAETGRQVRALVGQKGHRFAQAHARRRDALEGGRVLLVELFEAVGLDVAVQADHGGERHLHAAVGADVEAIERLRGQALIGLGLRDYVIGAALQAKTVGVVFAHQHRQGAGDVLQANTQAVGLAAVDAHLGHRVVEVQVAVDHGEQPAGPCLLFDLVHGLIQRAVVFGAANHQLHRQATGGGGQRRHLEDEDRVAFHCVDSLLQLALNLDGAALALIPLTEVDPGKTRRHSIRAVDDPGAGGFRELGQQLAQLGGVALHEVEVGVLRRLDRQQQVALVFIGCQLFIGLAIEQRQAEQHQPPERQHRTACAQ